MDLALDDASNLWAEFGFARNEISRDVSPSFPVLNTPLVSAGNPGNTFGEAVFFQGRPYGFGHPPEINYYHHDTSRLALGIEGRLSDRAEWNAAVVHAVNDALLNPRDVVAANFQAALQGFGGNGCDTSPTAPEPAVAGEGGCLFFNPFSSNFSARPGDPLFNSPELRDFIIGDYFGDGESTLTSVEANVTGFLSGYRAGYAFGIQYRDQSLTFAYDTVTRQDGFAFLIGNANFEAEDDAIAAYGEFWLPLSTRLEATGALRYEDYGEGVGDTLDPKLTVLYRASDALTFRGSFSTSFRAPSPFQTRGVQTNFTNIVDHDGSRTFAGRRTLGDSQLQPETSSAYNVGVSWRTVNWAINADFWRYAFEDVLRKENAQAIVNADPFDPRVERTSAGTISIVNVAFINADRIETTGLDLSARADFATARGILSAWAEAAWLFTYDVTNAGVEIDGLGKLNRANVGVPNQRLRFAGGLGWTREKVRLNALARHVGAYEDDGGGNIDGFSTLDANATWSVGTWRGSETTLTVGAANLLDADPPHVNIAGSYDPRSADPRGRRVYLRVRATR